MLSVSRLVRSVNAAFGLQTYNLAFITPPNDLLESLKEDFKTQVVYYNDTDIANKRMYVGKPISTVLKLYIFL